MMIVQALELEFFQRAILAGILASIACGIIGTYVVVKKMASVSGGLSHAAFGGIGISYFFGLNPVLGAVAFTIVSALAVGVAYLKQHQNIDTLIAMIWSIGMAIGVIFIAISPGYAPDLSGYLFGSILFVPYDYIIMVALLDLAIIAIVYWLAHYFAAVAFDEEFAIVSGVKVDRVFLVLMVLIAFAIVTLMRVVGVIMLIALLTTPAAIARQWSDTLQRMMVLATAISVICTTSGLYFAYWLSAAYGVNVPTGPLIIVISFILYGLSSTYTRARPRFGNS